MDKFFTGTFIKFFFGFVVIITVAFGVMMVASNFLGVPQNVDNVANPQ